VYQNRWNIEAICNKTLMEIHSAFDPLVVIAPPYSSLNLSLNTLPLLQAVLHPPPLQLYP